MAKPGVAPLPKLAHPPGPYVKAPNPGGLQLKAPPSLAGTSQPEQVQSAQQQPQYKPAPQVPAPVPTQHLADWMVLWGVNGEPYYDHAPSSMVQWECPAILQVAAPTFATGLPGHGPLPDEWLRDFVEDEIMRHFELVQAVNLTQPQELGNAPRDFVGAPEALRRNPR